MRTLVPFIAFIVSLSALADPNPKEIGKITYLQIHQNPDDAQRDDQRYVVTLDGEMNVAHNCGTNRWSGYFDTEAGKAQYATLLALYMADKPVYIQGTSADHCLANNVLIRNVYPEW